jgi:hypothetical protein
MNLGINKFDSKHSYLSFQKILKKIEKDKKNFGSFFGHFAFIHFPVHHDENSEFSIYPFPNSEKTLINQAHYIIHSMKETMDVLKKNDIYDQSLIVFKSDHGKLREEKLNSSNVLLFKNHSNLLPKALK